MKIREITTLDLAEKINRGDKFKLVMTFHEPAFKAKHIPSSLNIYSEESATGLIKPSDEIIVYCVNEKCQASITAYNILHNMGFENLRRYAGGLMAWEAAGYELEGEDINKKVDADDNFIM